MLDRTQPFPCDVHEIAGQCGIRILKPGAKRFSDAGKKVCFCPKTLKWIGRAHGADHLRLVLRLIVESDGNAGELQMETVTAVSNVVLSGLVEIRADLLDKVNLGHLREFSKSMRSKSISTIAAMTTALLYLLTDPQKIFPQPSAEEIAAAAAEEKRREIRRKSRANAKRRRLRRYAGAAA